MRASQGALQQLMLMAVMGLAALQANAQFNSGRTHRRLQERIQACRRRGGGAYCSAPRPGGYVGPINTAQQLREALKVTSFKNEIIVFADTRIADAVQAVTRIRGAAGYGHLLPVLTEPHQCHRLVHIFAPFTDEQGPLSCGTYDTQDERGERYPQEFRYLKSGFGMTAWWRKWFTVARSVVLGYNVMAIDSDVLVLDDWYWRVKQPPFSSYHMMSQAECDICINGGFSYIQNASSQGPVAWILYEAMHRAVRWAEDRSAVMALSARLTREPQWIACPDDQALLSDALWNAIIGGIRFGSMRCMVDGDDDALRKLGYANSGEFIGRNIPGHNGSADFYFQDYTLTGELAEVACEGFREDVDCRTFGTSVTIRSAVVRMPHSGGVWPPEYGGYPFNREPGPYTQAYRQAFLDLGVPLPPDPEDPATEAQARSTPTEMFALLHVESVRNQPGRCSGCWLESHWYSTGRLGLWHTHLNVPAVQSIGHIHAGLYPGDFQKTVVLQAAGHFDWRVAGRIGGSPTHVFFANYPDHDAFNYGESDRVEEIQRVVSYAPGIIPSTIAKEDFIRAATGLAQVAAALGAVVAWPAAPCQADWVLSPVGKAAGGGPPPGSGFIPWHHLNTQYVVLPFGDTLETLQCEWTGFASTDCLMNRRHRGGSGDDSGRGLLAMEFEHLRRYHVREGHGTSFEPFSSSGLRQPTPSTTLRLSKDTAPPAPGQFYDIHMDQLLRLNREVLLQQLHERDPVQIFWVDRLVGAVQGLAGTAERVYSTWRQRCRVLKYFELDERQRNSW